MKENAIVIRRFVEHIEQLKGGEMELEKGQFGFARNDRTLVCRDTNGEYHHIKTDTAMLDLILVKEPVETAGSLPGDDATGTLRMVLNSNSYYFKTGSNWVRMPDINYYDEQLNEIKNKARNINVTDNHNGSFSFTDYEGDETTIQSGKKVQSSDETVDITEGTDNFDLSIERSLNETKQEISQTYVKKTDIDIAGGVAGLDINSKIKLSQIPDSILGQLKYSGIYYATTGAMKVDLREPTGRAWKQGDYVIAEENGNKLPDGTDNETQINTGDWAVHNGTTWDIIRNSDAVTSVDGKTGNVVLNFGLDAETESGTNITTPAVPSGAIRIVMQAVWAKIRQLANALAGKMNVGAAAGGDLTESYPNPRANFYIATGTSTSTSGYRRIASIFLGSSGGGNFAVLKISGAMRNNAKAIIDGVVQVSYANSALQYIYFGGILTRPADLTYKIEGTTLYLLMPSYTWDGYNLHLLGLDKTYQDGNYGMWKSAIGIDTDAGTQVPTIGTSSQFFRGDGGLANRAGRAVSGNITVGVADTVLKLTGNATLGSGIFDGQKLTIYNGQYKANSILTIGKYAIPRTINAGTNFPIEMACGMMELVWDATHDCWKTFYNEHIPTYSIGAGGQTPETAFNKNKYLYVFSPSFGTIDLTTNHNFDITDIGKVYTFVGISAWVTYLRVNIQTGIQTINLQGSNPAIRLTLINVNNGIGLFAA